MQVIEVDFENERYIVAVSLNADKVNKLFGELKKSNQANIEIKPLPLKEFPVYAIEKHQNDESGGIRNHFEYTDEQGYIELIKLQKQQRGEDNFNVYFTAHHFEEEYLMDPADHNLMHNIDYVQVNNYFLDTEEAEMGLEHSRIGRLASRWDFEGLDRLYAKYVEDGTADEREKLAVDGYLSLFSSMDYDFACGKLTGKGIALLLPLAEKASTLLGKKLWDVYSRVYMILLEDAIENNEEQIACYFNETERAIQSNMLETVDEQQEGYRQLALINDMLAEYRHFGRQNWQRALAFINTSIAQEPAEGDWFLYLQLIYIPYEVRKGRKMTGLSDEQISDRYEEWRRLRPDELTKFKALAVSFPDSRHAVALNIAMAMKRLREHMEWYKMDGDYFPEEDYLHWLKEATQWQKQKTTRISLTEAGHFFHTEGQRYQRIDLLETAILHFERLIDQVDTPSFEVYYKASALENIADIFFLKKDNHQGMEYLNRATLFYKDHIDLVKANPSVLMHYTEYLERCYVHPANIIKPSMEELKAFATIAEDQGDGMYASPVMLRIRLALLEGDENEALYHMLKSLVLFELTIEESLKTLAQMSAIKNSEKLSQFLDNTFEFFDEIRENYYLDARLKWKQIKQMAPEEVAKAWEERQEEIRKREKITWS